MATKPVDTHKAVVTWQDSKVTITFDDVKKYLCPGASDKEIIVFLKLAQSLNLNPWAREVYLVKYKEDEPASYVVASEAYLKAAEQCPEYDGHEAGIIISTTSGIERREGTFMLPEESSKLVGSWARVYRKDRQKPFFVSVNFKECAKYTKDGKLTRFWATMPGTMVRKVALARALREAFPTRLGSMVVEAEYEDLPATLVKEGKPNWKKFYAKIKSELELTEKQAHEIAEVESFKELLERGWTMEKIWDLLISKLQEKRAAEAGADVETGEITAEEEELFGESEPEETVAEIRREAEIVKEETKKLKRDPETVRSINDLTRACWEDFAMQPRDVYRECGYSKASDITELPSELYRRIATVREEVPGES